MKNLSWTLWIATVAVLGFSLTSILDADEDGHGHKHGNLAERVAKAVQGKSFSVADAVRAAEAKTGGRALQAELEIEDGKAVIDVTILKTGATDQILEVEVDGKTNQVLEVDGDDDSDSDDGDSDSDSEGHDDDSDHHHGHDDDDSDHHHGHEDDSDHHHGHDDDSDEI